MKLVAGLICVLVFLNACTKSLTPEEKEKVAALQSELSILRIEIESAKADDAKLSGGLVKALIAVRLEVLKTNEALIQQRVHAIEGKSNGEIVTLVSVVDAPRAKALAQELELQRSKLAEAKAESDKYAGGLVKALAESAVAATANTIALLEQQRVISTYGLALPKLQNSTAISDASKKDLLPSSPTIAPIASAQNCLKVENFDSSVLTSNSTFTEMAWKVDVSNSCATSMDVKVVFKFSDKDEFELDTDYENLRISANSTGKARGKMLVSPSEKARRISSHSVSLSY